MKHCLILSAILIISLSALSQSMVSLFRVLPADCIPDLNRKAKDILLKKGTYVLPGGDSLNTIQYEIDTAYAEDYIHCDYRYTTGQNGFEAFELKKFTRINGKSFLIFSHNAGVKVEFHQLHLRIFNIENNKLIESKVKLLPENIDINEFLKKDMPDSIRQQIVSNASTSYDLYPRTKNAIEFRISFYGAGDEYEQFLKGDVILFTWNGSSFTKKIIKH